MPSRPPAALPCSLLLASALAAMSPGCRSNHASTTSPEVPFSDVTQAAGIRFRHEHGGQSPLSILETAGAGCAFLDYDQDGFLDVFLVNGCRRDVPIGRRPPRHALYRNNHDGTFTDVSKRAGFTDQLYGMGCVAADYDGDGDPDLLLTGYEGLALYRNNRDGTWEDVTETAGLADKVWRTSAAFADVDYDGWLDLYVCGYVRFTPDSPQTCEVQGVQVACPPRYYEREPGRLFRNNGNGTFTDITRASGTLAPGNSLGCLFLDYDHDGYPDLYVANDGIANCLFRNLGPRAGKHPIFEDRALELGVAYGEGGTGDASMGVDAADFDGNGQLDLLTTNFQGETDALYRNVGASGFEHVSSRVGLESTRPFLSFGCGFLDYDLDGQSDLFVASGHVQDRIHAIDPECTFPQARALYRGEGGRFHPISAGTALSQPFVGRGAAFGDYDNDGDTDVLVSNCGGPALLLRNEYQGPHHWARIRLVGRPPNQDAVGARVTLKTMSGTQTQEVRAGSSYASSSDPRLLFGLGQETSAVIGVHWPGGKADEFQITELDREIVVRESGGSLTTRRAQGTRGVILSFPSAP